MAPTDAAFASLSGGAPEDLLADPEALKKVLTMHVIAGKAMAADVVELTEGTTLEGSTLPVSIEDGVTSGEAMVPTPDIEVSNGVIHVIDSVILL